MSKLDAKNRPIWTLAVNAAKKAADECRPVPMVVTQHSSPLDDRSPVVKAWKAPEGVCGFAWLRMKGNTSFARWLVAQKLARPAYPSGISVSAFSVVPSINQSMERGEAAMLAMVRVLAEHGVDCWMESRMD